MRLRIEGDARSPRVFNDETGEGIVLELTDASIDLTVGGAEHAVQAYGVEQDKYAHMPLGKVRGLRWLRRNTPQPDQEDPDA